MYELKILREINFDWTMHVGGIWTDFKFSSLKLNKRLRSDILDDFDRLINSIDGFSPLGRIVLGTAGAGKTHFLGELRREIFSRSAGFVLVDMTDITDFYETVVLGFLNSLQQTYDNNRTQGQVVFHHLLGMFKVTLFKKQLTTKQLIKEIHNLNGKQLNKLRCCIINALRQKYRETAEFRDVILAFLLFNSHDFHEQDVGYLWLQGHKIDEIDRNNYKFNTNKGKYTNIIKGLSWLMNLKFPVLLAMDQFDAIIAEQSLNYGDKFNSSLSSSSSSSFILEQNKSHKFIEKIAGGLMGLRDITFRTLTVAACLETTWESLRRNTLKSSTDRFKPPVLLSQISKSEIAEKIIGSRLSYAYSQVNFTPPYPTWPIKPVAFETAKAFFPREILKKCDEFIQQCINANTVFELDSFLKTLDFENKKSLSPKVNDKFNKTFMKFHNKTPIVDILNDDNEDNLLRHIIQAACRCLIKEIEISDNKNVVVETNFAGGLAYWTLHARVCIIYHNQGQSQGKQEERYFSVRGLQKTNSLSFQTRLKAAIAESEINSAIKSKHLLILRHGKIPTGSKTEKLIDQFKNAGGNLEGLTEKMIRTFWALSEMEKLKLPDFEKWLFQKKSISKMKCFKQLLSWL